MKKILKNLRVKILILFSIIFAIILAVSLFNTYKSYNRYVTVKKIDKKITYIKYALNLINSLQKERGLSISCIANSNFCNDVKKQRVYTDIYKNRYISYLETTSPHNLSNKDISEVIDALNSIRYIRKAINRRSVDYKYILISYSQIIEKLINSIDILNSERKLISSFYYKALTFNEIIKITEVIAKERALVLYVIDKGSIDQASLIRELKGLNIEYQTLKNIIEDTAPYKIKILCSKIVSQDLEDKLIGIIKIIIYKDNPQIISAREWWKLSTEYIDSLYKFEEKILKNIILDKKRLEKEVDSMLLYNILFVLFSIAVLIYIYILFKNIFRNIDLTLKKEETEKSLYKVFVDFIDNFQFIKDREALLNFIGLIVGKVEAFKFLYIIDVKSTPKIIFSEKSPISQINKDRFKNDLPVIEEVEEKKIYKIVDFKTDSSIYLPVILNGKIVCIMVIVVKSPDYLNSHIIKLILKISDLIELSISEISKNREYKKLKEELNIHSKAFESHEAIVITDKNSDILKVNRAFEDITGYSAQEVIGKTPSILKSGKHNREFYQNMWDTIKNEGYWKGEIYNRKKDGTIYPEILSITALKNKEGKITHYISHFFDISDLQKAYEENNYKANYDLLTEIYNRKKLLDELAIVRNIAIKEKFWNAFFFIDLDNFKYINDSYGHSVGDKVLIEVASRLKSLTRGKDFVGRISGDEFAFVQVDLGKNKEIASSKAAILAEKMLDYYSEPILVNDIEIEISFSIGIYIFPQYENSSEEIVINADIAMYHSKKNGKHSFSFFNKKLDEESKRFLIMKKKIEDGLKKREFIVRYQPKVDLKSDEVVGFEALTIWDSSLDGIVPPNEFLEFMRGNTLLYIFTEYVFQEVTETLKRWRKEGIYTNVSVNIPSELFNNKSFMNKIFRMIPPEMSRSITLEIVEDALVRDSKYAIDIIEKFKKQGVRFSIDDFGTGYSSLNYLKELPVDEIKIDKSFIINFSDDKNMEIIKMAVNIAKKFGFKVVAEGVETKEAKDFLKDIGCDYYQGFYFSKAVYENEVKRFFISQDKKEEE